MSLVLYPDSDSDGHDPEAQPAQNEAPSIQPPPTRDRGRPKDLKRKRSGESSHALPPLPAAFYDLYSANARVSTTDNPSFHGGRKRAVPHVEGNWPSHVYLEWIPSHTESEQLQSLIGSVQKAVGDANELRAKPLPKPNIIPSLLSSLGVPIPLHVSLSRTLQIKTDDRERYLETLTACLRHASVRSFEVISTSLKWVPNFHRDRWFLVLGIEKPAHDELNRLLEACNEASEKCGHPGLYIGGKGDGPMETCALLNNAQKRRKSSAKPEPAQESRIDERIDRTENFHISIAWNLEEPPQEWIDLVRGLDVNQSVKIPFDAVKVKIGNNVHSVPLGASTSTIRRGSSI